MKTYSIAEKPIEIFGVEVIDAKDKKFWRLPHEETVLVSEGVCARSKSACGGRVRFRTNSKSLTVKLELLTLNVHLYMAVCAASGADIFIGRGKNSKYAGLVNPEKYDNFFPETTIKLDGSMNEITVNLPRCEQIGGGWISVDDDAEVLAPLPYSKKGKMCFYGSSITEGGCCTRPGNAYASVVSRWLDTDYVNYGFSALAKGEDAMADIIAKRDFSAFIMDYDHNAPDAEHLEKTHERFFRRVREAKPDLPILMMTRPDFDSDPEECVKRREVIRRTYTNALAAGDKNVYFIDGETFFGTFGRDMCTVDGCHPNDLGFFRMAEAVYGKLLKAFHL